MPSSPKREIDVLIYSKLLLVPYISSGDRGAKIP
jgi:hypothetical protein